MSDHGENRVCDISELSLVPSISIYRPDHVAQLAEHWANSIPKVIGQHDLIPKLRLCLNCESYVKLRHRFRSMHRNY